MLGEGNKIHWEGNGSTPFRVCAKRLASKTIKVIPRLLCRRVEERRADGRSVAQRPESRLSHESMFAGPM